MTSHGLTAEPMTLVSAFDTLVRSRGDRTAIKTADTELTYADLDERSAKLANVFRSLGLSDTDTVGLLMENRSEFLVAQIAAARAGIVVVPLNSAMDEQAVEPILSDANVRTLVVGPSMFDIAKGLQQDGFAYHDIIGIEDRAELPIGFHGFAELLSKADAEPPDVSVSPDDTAAIHYTGGTTGRPKGTLHSHYSILLNLYAHIQELQLRPSERQLLVTPLGHSAGRFALAGLAQGATVVLRQRFDSESVLRLIEEESITWTYLVPTMISSLLDEPLVTEADLGSLETLVYGSAPITPSRLNEGLEALGDVFIQFYGLTEVPNIAAILPKAQHDPEAEQALNSAGFPATLVNVTVFTEENDFADDVGEVGIKAPYAVEEYLDGTPTHDEDGWVRTGDIGRIDDDGRLVVLDRKQDVIITDGEPVYSTEVENVIQRHPAIHQVAVIGIPETNHDRVRMDDLTVEQSIKAVVVPDEPTDFTLDELQAHCRETLPDRMVPESLDTVGTLPETAYGKVDKRLLKEPYW